MGMDKPMPPRHSSTMNGSTTTPAPHRDTALEALRGVAALIVVFWHLTVAFAPTRAGIFPGFDPGASINGEWWFAILNGSASVTFFFVLSGFVLTRRPLVTGNAASLLRGVAKRVPRLMGPVLIACLFSWILLRTGCYHYRVAASITGSPWLATFGYAAPPPAKDAPLWDAILQGLYSTLFAGVTGYDSSLWTMRLELVGSLIVYALALMMLALKRPVALGLPVMLMLVLLFINTEPHYVSFIAGIALAVVLPRTPRALPLPLALALAALAWWLSAYSDFTTHFDWLGIFKLNAIYLHTLCAMMAIYLVETVPLFHRTLSTRLGGWLGRLSFPIYLLHVPILCSAGCETFLLLQAHGPAVAKIGAIGATVAVTILCAIPFGVADVTWTRYLARKAQDWVKI
jgi:peptidoglycan/LPS O-acetylase OafA/YrhL